VEGLTVCVKQQPEDAVQFLGEYLVNFAAHVERKTKAKIADAEHAAQVARAAEEEAAAAASAAEAAKSSPAVLLAAAEAEVQALLDAATEVDTPLLYTVAAAVSKMLSASVYVAEQTGAPKAAEEDGVQTAKIRYLATSTGQEFLVKDGCYITDPAAVTFKAWIMPEAAPVEEEAPPAEEEGARPRPPRRRPRPRSCPSSTSRTCCGSRRWSSTPSPAPARTWQRPSSTARPSTMALCLSRRRWWRRSRARTARPLRSRLPSPPPSCACAAWRCALTTWGRTATSAVPRWQRSSASRAACRLRTCERRARGTRRRRRRCWRP